MNDHNRKHFEDFFKAIEPNLPGYQHAYFSYVSLKRDDMFELTQGRLQLQGVPLSTPSGCFQSENIRAGIFRLSESNLNPREFVECLLSGTLQIPHGILVFPSEENRSHSVQFSPYHADEVSTQRRQIQLRISGAKRLQVWPSVLDWELKGSPTPFFNLQELCEEFLVGPMAGDFVMVEVNAHNVAAIAPESSIEGNSAKLALVLADGLPTEKAAIGYRVFDRNRVVKRGTLRGADLVWVKGDDLPRGSCEIAVPTGAVVDCVAKYAGTAQSHRWVADPKTAQNPFRSVHHAFDNNLEVLQELIAKAQNRGANARDLEIAASWLLWMLGFCATHIGGTSKTSDAPDLIAATPRGDLVVIECTTGILKEDSKLSHLYQRTEKIRQSLTASGNQHLKVLSVIVTTKTRDEIKAEVDQAHKLGVLVAAREDFQDLINQTMLFPDPGALFARAEQTLRRLQNPSPFAELSMKP